MFTIFAWQKWRKRSQSRFLLQILNIQNSRAFSAYLLFLKIRFISKFHSDKFEHFKTSFQLSNWRYTNRNIEIDVHTPFLVTQAVKYLSSHKTQSEVSRNLEPISRYLSIEPFKNIEQWSYFDEPGQ